MATDKEESSLEALLHRLAREEVWGGDNGGGFDLYRWEGVWFSRGTLEGTLNMRSHFEPRHDDVLLASGMKTGTTWLKALCSCIMMMKSPHGGHPAEEEEEDILVKNNPHACVKTLEFTCYMGNPCPDLSGMPAPRLFHTHVPYSLLPDSIKDSDCKIIYIARNPKDTFVSMWHHFNTLYRPNQEPLSLEAQFDNFCKGVIIYGPFFDHVLQYWKQSLKMPQKILFLKYEDLKRDPKGQVKRLASFLGKPLEKDEEVEKVLWRCDFDRLKNLEVNTNNGSRVWAVIPNSIFFRAGIAGGWKSYLTPEMEDRLDRITRKDLEGTGLELDI